MIRRNYSGALAVLGGGAFAYFILEIIKNMRRTHLGALAVLGGGAFAYMAGPGLLIIGG